MVMSVSTEGATLTTLSTRRARGHYQPLGLVKAQLGRPSLPVGCQTSGLGRAGSCQMSSSRRTIPGPEKMLISKEETSLLVQTTEHHGPR